MRVESVMGAVIAADWLSDRERCMAYNERRDERGLESELKISVEHWRSSLAALPSVILNVW